MDHMLLPVEARPHTPPDRRDTAATTLTRAIKDSVGVTVEVQLVDPDTLERSVGKLKRVKDLRDSPS